MRSSPGPGRQRRAAGDEVSEGGGHVEGRVTDGDGGERQRKCGEPEDGDDGSPGTRRTEAPGCRGVVERGNGGVHGPGARFIRSLGEARHDLGHLRSRTRPEAVRDVDRPVCPREGLKTGWCRSVSAREGQPGAPHRRRSGPGSPAPPLRGAPARRSRPISAETLTRPAAGSARPEPAGCHREGVRTHHQGA